MRFLAYIALALLAGPRLVAAADEPMSERDAATLVNTYVTADLAAPRRREIVLSLRNGSPILAQRSILQALADEEKRPRALDLATELRVPGLLSAAKAYIETPDEDRVVRLLLATQDEGAVDFLLQRMRKVAVETAGYAYIVRGLIEVRVFDAVNLEQVRRELTSKEPRRRDDAAAILAAQLELSSAEPEEVEKSFDSALADFKADSKRIADGGVGLLHLVADSSTGVRRVGGNFRVRKAGRLELGPLPAALQAGNWTVRVMVKVKSGEGAGVGITMDEGHVWSARVKDGEWIVKEEFGSEVFSPAKFGKWVVVELTWTDQSTASTRFDRVLSVSVDGTVILQRGTLNGKLTSIIVESGTGEVVVGSANYRKPAK